MPIPVSKASENLTALKSDLREIESLKRVAVDISRLNKETTDLERDIVNLESELAVSGSTRTTDDVQAKMDELSDSM
jgi:DNA repair protein RAD50